MSVEIRCMCGKQLRAADEYAGAPARCPDCGRIWQLPESPGACVSYEEAIEETCVTCRAGFSLESDWLPKKIEDGRYCHQKCATATAAATARKGDDPPERSQPSPVSAQSKQVAVCPICGDSCTERRRVKDKRGRVFHQSCYQQALRRQQAQQRSQQRQEESAPPARPADPGRIVHVQVNDTLACTNSSCNRAFRVNQSSQLNEHDMLCPLCRAKLEVQRCEPAPSPAIQNDLSDLLDEVMPTSGSEQDFGNRKRLQELLVLADRGEWVSPEQTSQIRNLIDTCRRSDPGKCPGCGVEVEVAAVVCTMCNLDFAKGQRLKKKVKTTHPLIAKAQREIKEEERKAREAQAEQVREGAMVVLDIMEIISGM